MKKISLLVLSLVLASVLFIGCSKTDSTDSLVSIGSGDSATDQVEEEGVIELKMFGYKTGNEEGAIPELIEKFNAENEDINVTYEGISNAGGYENILKTRLASGQGDDLFFSNSNYLAELVMAGYTEDLSDQAVVQEYSDVVNALQTVEGTVPTVVMEVAVFGMFVNTSLLEEVGISEIPNNYSDFLIACEALKAAGKTPIVTGAKDGTGTALFTLPKSLGEDYLSGAIFDNFEAYNSGDIMFGDANREGFELLKELVDAEYINGPKALVTSLGQDAVAEFATGEAGFMPGGSWLTAGIDTAATTEFDYVLAGIPVLDDDSIVLVNPATKICVNSSSENKEAALKFLEFFASVDSVNTYVNSQNSFNPIIGGKSTDNPTVAPAAERIAEQMMMPWSDTNFNAKVINGWSDSKKFSSFIAGGADVDTTIEELNNQIENNLKLQ